VKKVGRILGGFSLIAIGLVLALPFVPGPGIPLMILGFVLLAEHFSWARRLVDWGKAKIEGATARRNPKNTESSLSK
jgi:hypothetical protein